MTEMLSGEKKKIDEQPSKVRRACDVAETPPRSASFADIYLARASSDITHRPCCAQRVLITWCMYPPGIHGFPKLGIGDIKGGMPHSVVRLSPTETRRISRSVMSVVFSIQPRLFHPNQGRQKRQFEMPVFSALLVLPLSLPRSLVAFGTRYKTQDITNLRPPPSPNRQRTQCARQTHTQIMRKAEQHFAEQPTYQPTCTPVCWRRTLDG